MVLGAGVLGAIARAPAPIVGLSHRAQDGKVYPAPFP